MSHQIPLFPHFLFCFLLWQHSSCPGRTCTISLSFTPRAKAVSQSQKHKLFFFLFSTFTSGTGSCGLQTYILQQLISLPCVLDEIQVLTLLMGNSQTHHRIILQQGLLHCINVLIMKCLSKEHMTNRLF